ncbi:hypothetical protein Tsubulata_026259 [Turnera subulata]|uniref:Uncharacterized protein n=1 Tax=Turnera subulata TaxID=218843 RepID=A0A9Q0JBF6_9ROSI|nr:hypothetical protein Tsubulata_026259 [Turnera subulata]
MSQWFFKKTQAELDKQNPFHNIINAINWDDIVLVQDSDLVEIIANDQGNRITPSWVSIIDTERLIGEGAKNQVVVNPKRTIFDASCHGICSSLWTPWNRVAASPVASPTTHATRCCQVKPPPSPPCLAVAIPSAARRRLQLQATDTATELLLLQHHLPRLTTAASASPSSDCRCHRDSGDTTR